MNFDDQYKSCIKDIQTHLSMLNEGILSKEECIKNIHQATIDCLSNVKASIRTDFYAAYQRDSRRYNPADTCSEIACCNPCHGR